MNRECNRLTLKVVYRSIKNRDEVGASSVDYLMYSGYVVMAYFWAMMAEKAEEQLAAGTTEVDFYRGKIETAKFYFDKILPRTSAHRESIMSGSSSLMDISEEAFAVVG